MRAKGEGSIFFSEAFDRWLADHDAEVRAVALINQGKPQITEQMVEYGARALNEAGWTAEQGSHEPGCWCEDCEKVCRPIARAVLEAALGEKNE